MPRPNLTLLLLPLLAAALGWLDHSAWADPTLKDVCGSQTQHKFAGAPQLEQLCNAAYTNANLWIINDNNSRVRASVAVVCAYSCLSGGLGSCSGGPDGGGSPCSTAVGSGWKSYNYSNASDENLYDAQKNGATSIPYQQDSASVAGLGSGAGGAGGGAVSLSATCQRAGSGGSVQDRIACAQETDPSIPSFVQSPQFMEDFQKATGVPIQAVINKSGETLFERLRHALPSERVLFHERQSVDGGLPERRSQSDWRDAGESRIQRRSGQVPCLRGPPLAQRTDPGRVARRIGERAEGRG